MKTKIALFLMTAFAATSFIACDTQKPANEVEDAKVRMEKKMEDSREQQTDSEAAKEANE